MKPQLDKRQNIRLDAAMLSNVSKIAAEEDRTVSSMLRILVKEALSKRKGVTSSDKGKLASIRPSTTV